MTGGSHVHPDKYLGVAWRTVRRPRADCPRGRCYKILSPLARGFPLAAVLTALHWFDDLFMLPLPVVAAGDDECSNFSLRWIISLSSRTSWKWILCDTSLCS